MSAIFPDFLLPFSSCHASQFAFHLSGLLLRFQDVSWVYAIYSRWGTEQPRSSFGLIFLLFPTKLAGALAHSSWGKSLALSDSPDLCPGANQGLLYKGGRGEGKLDKEGSGGRGSF